QYRVLADQLFTDQIQLRLAVPVQRGQIKKGVAKLLGADQRQITRLGQLVLHQIGNKRDLILAGLLAGAASGLYIQQFFLNNSPGQAGKNGRIHRQGQSRSGYGHHAHTDYADYSTATPLPTKHTFSPECSCAGLASTCSKTVWLSG